MVVIDGQFDIYSSIKPPLVPQAGQTRVVASVFGSKLSYLSMCGRYYDDVSVALVGSTKTKTHYCNVRRM